MLIHTDSTFPRVYCMNFESLGEASHILPRNQKQNKSYRRGWSSLIDVLFHQMWQSCIRVHSVLKYIRYCFIIKTNHWSQTVSALCCCISVLHFLSSFWHFFNFELPPSLKYDISKLLTHSSRIVGYIIMICGVASCIKWIQIRHNRLNEDSYCDILCERKKS